MISLLETLKERKTTASPLSMLTHLPAIEPVSSAQLAELAVRDVVSSSSLDMQMEIVSMALTPVHSDSTVTNS